MNSVKWTKSPRAIIIGIVTLGLFITIGYDYSQGNPILTRAGEITIIIWDVIIAFLNFDIKMWWLILLFLIFIFTLFLIIHFKEKERNRNSAENQ
jgi:hypothetical protein